MSGVGWPPFEPVEFGVFHADELPTLLRRARRGRGPPPRRPGPADPRRWGTRRSPTGWRRVGWRWWTACGRRVPTSGPDARRVERLRPRAAVGLRARVRPAGRLRGRPPRRPVPLGGHAAGGVDRPGPGPARGRAVGARTRRWPSSSPSRASRLVPGVFDAGRGRATLRPEVTRLTDAARPDDQRSWWARTGDGDDVCCRLLYTEERSDLITEVVTGDDRLADLAGPDRARTCAWPPTASTA